MDWKGWYLFLHCLLCVSPLGFKDLLFVALCFPPESKEKPPNQIILLEI